MATGALRLPLSLAGAALALLGAAGGGAPASAARGPGAAPAGAHAAVVGGRAAPAGSFPYLALVQHDVGAHRAGLLCTGTIVSPNTVLTAAHCVVDPLTHRLYPASQFEVGTGTVDVNNPKGLEVSRVARIAIFPSRTYLVDAAVLVLATPTREPALPLATAADARYLTAGTPAATIGWGETYYGQSSTSEGRLHWGLLVLQSPTWCQRDVKPSGVVGFNAGEQLCAVDPHFETSPCYGDSGGPLVVQTGPRTDVDVGIYSMGGPRCRPIYAAYFTRVDLVSSFVQGIALQAIHG